MRILLLLAITLLQCLSMPIQANQINASISLNDWQAAKKDFQFNNHRIAYWQTDNPTRNQAKETIVLVHGFPSAAWDWHHVWDTLSKDYHLIALDLLGYGYSDKPKPYEYSLIEQADIVLELTQALGIKKFHLLSHDYGVSVSQELLARNEETKGETFLLSFCFLNGGAFAETQNPTLGMKALRSALGPMLAKMGTQSIFERQFADVFGKQTQPGKDILSGYWQLVNEQNGRSVMPYLLKYGDERHVYRDRWVNAMQKTKVPLRIIIGMEDELSGANLVKRYETLIPNPDVVRLDGIGHYPQVEAPEQVINAYKAFLTGHS